MKIKMNINDKNTLFVIFSYNRTTELKTCLSSLFKNAPSAQCIVFDDGSVTLETHEILKSYEKSFTQIIWPKFEPKMNTRGRLAENIQSAYDMALEQKFEYMFFIQDDMQFVRPFDRHIKNQYSEIFLKDETIIQIDPRFLRDLGHIEIDASLNAYRFPDGDDRSSFADVGIFSVTRLKKLNWTFEATERKNKVKAHSLGLKRIFPFSPIFMHVPYPVIYRKGKIRNKFPSPFVTRGKVLFEDMNVHEQRAMDNRPIEQIPYTKSFLKPLNLGLAKMHYRYSKENKIYC
jgi:hypothetical protein